MHKHWFGRTATESPSERSEVRFEDNAMDRIISFSSGRLPALRVTRHEEVLRGSTIQGTMSGTHSAAALHTHTSFRAGGEAFNIHVAAIKTN